MRYFFFAALILASIETYAAPFSCHVMVRSKHSADPSFEGAAKIDLSQFDSFEKVAIPRTSWVLVDTSGQYTREGIVAVSVVAPTQEKPFLTAATLLQPDRESFMLSQFEDEAYSASIACESHSDEGNSP
jgi:hypothetical protein